MSTRPRQRLGCRDVCHDYKPRILLYATPHGGGARHVYLDKFPHIDQARLGNMRGNPVHHISLTHWCWVKMANIFLTFSNHFLEWKYVKLINISLKFVPNGLINNMTALLQIMAWCRPGDKALSEPIMVSLMTHICVTRPQWLKHVIPLPSKTWFRSQSGPICELSVSLNTWAWLTYPAIWDRFKRNHKYIFLLVTSASLQLCDIE